MRRTPSHRPPRHPGGSVPALSTFRQIPIHQRHSKRTRELRRERRRHPSGLGAQGGHPPSAQDTRYRRSLALAQQRLRPPLPAPGEPLAHVPPIRGRRPGTRAGPRLRLVREGTWAQRRQPLPAAYPCPRFPTNSTVPSTFGPAAFVTRARTGGVGCRRRNAIDDEARFPLPKKPRSDTTECLPSASGRHLAGNYSVAGPASACDVLGSGLRRTLRR